MGSAKKHLVPRLELQQPPLLIVVGFLALLGCLKEASGLPYPSVDGSDIVNSSWCLNGAECSIVVRYVDFPKKNTYDTV